MSKISIKIPAKMINFDDKPNFFSPTSLRVIKNHSTAKHKSKELITSMSTTNYSNSNKFKTYTSSLSPKKSSESHHDYNLTRSTEFNSTSQARANLPPKKEELMGSEDMRTRGIILNLDYWDLNHVYKNNPSKNFDLNKFYRANQFREKIKKELTNGSIEIQNINLKNQLKENIAKLNLKNLHPHISEFSRLTDQEQATVLAQNINMMKRKFQFDVFQESNIKNKTERIVQRKPLESKSVNNILTYNSKFKHALSSYVEGDTEDELFRVGTQLTIRRKDKMYPDMFEHENERLRNIKVEDPILKFNNLKLEGNYELLTNTDYYREIICEKDKVERVYRNEIFKLSKIMEDKYEKKQHLVERNRIMTEELTNSKDQLDFYKNNYENLRSEAEKMNKNDYERLHEINKKIVKQHTHLEEFERIHDRIERRHSDLIAKNKRMIGELTEEIKELKNYKAKIIKEMSTYYLTLLKKGIDVRNEGLSWIIFQLLELGTKFDEESFPRFLDKSQIDYLIYTGHLKLELAQLKVILKVLKKKYKTNGRVFQELIEKLSEREKLKKNIPMSKLISVSSFSTERYDEHISAKLMKLMVETMTKNETAMKISFDDRVDGEQVIYLTLSYK